MKGSEGTLEDYINCLEDIAERPEKYSEESILDTIKFLKIRLCSMGTDDSQYFSYSDLADILNCIINIEKRMYDSRISIKTDMKNLRLDVTKYFTNGEVKK